MKVPCRLSASLFLVAAAFVALIAGKSAPAATLVGNGSFENTGSGWLSPWYLAVKSGGGGNVSQTGTTSAHGSYSALVNVTQASASAPWLVQLSQSRLHLAAGQAYTVSFSAKASGARALDVVLQQTASPYAVRTERRVSLSTAWQSFTLSYSAGVSDSDASLHFNLAAATGSVWIDNVSLSSASPSPSQAPTPSPTPSRPPATPTPSPPPATTPAATYSLAPIEDATVQAASPSTNFGSSATLTSDGQPATASYMKFDLAALSGRSISSARLRMKVTNGSGSTQALRSTSNSWSESGITYNQRPSLGASFTTFQGGALGAWVEVDVMAGMSGKAGQIVTIAIDSAGSDGYAFNSRNAAADRVVLIVAAQGGGATPAPTPTPAGATPVPTPAQTPAPATVGSGKGVSLRPFAEYWGSNTAGMNSDLADMKAGNISWARMDLFHTASPNPAFDAAIQAAKNNGIKVVVVVHKSPPLKDLGTEADRAAYRSWLAQVVNRYKYHVKHWQIHNEPNLHYEWNIDDSSGSSQSQYVAAVHRYVSHLQDGFQTVKTNDPSATVLMGGLSEWTVERYMDVLTTTQAYRYFDAIAFHPYGYNPDRVLSRFNSFKSKLNLNANYAAKPIWVTEIGFNTSWSNKAGYVSSEQQKADYLAQALRRLDDAGARLPIFWYTLHESESASGFGLTRKNKTTLQTTFFPAFYKYRDLVLPGP